MWTLLSRRRSTTQLVCESVPFSLIELGARTASLDVQTYRLNSGAFPRRDRWRASRSTGSDHLMTAMPSETWQVLRAFSIILMPICTKAHVMPNRQLWFGTQDSPAVGRNSSRRASAITTLVTRHCSCIRARPAGPLHAKAVEIVEHAPSYVHSALLLVHACMWSNTIYAS